MTSRMFADDSVYKYEMEEVDAMQEQRRGTTRKEEDKKRTGQTRLLQREERRRGEGECLGW